MRYLTLLLVLFSLTSLGQTNLVVYSGAVVDTQYVRTTGGDKQYSPILYNPSIVGDLTTDGNITTIGKLFTNDSLTTQKESSSLADDGTITLATGQSGFGTLFIDSAGVRMIKIEFSFEDDGTPYIDESFGKGWITTATSDSDGKVCIYDGGSGIIIKQRLGGRRGARLVVNYATN